MEEVVRQAAPLRKRFFSEDGIEFGLAEIAFRDSLGYKSVLQKEGGALASTRCLKRRRHVEDGSLASLKSGPKKINADHQDLALAA